LHVVQEHPSQAESNAVIAKRHKDTYRNGCPWLVFG